MSKPPTSNAIERTVPVALTLALFFVSGACALMYQVVWARLMTHVFGSTALAVGTVLAAFMSGLALGSWYAGKAADRSGNCFRLYAWLEIAIVPAALASHALLHRMDAVYPLAHDLLGGSPPLVALARFALAFLLVLAPTLLMGATLPVLSRFLLNQPAGRPAFVGGRLSSLYAANTAGAVVGVVVTGFFLIGRYGIHVPVYLAAAGNLLIGVVAWLASRRMTASPTLLPEQAEPVSGPVGLTVAGTAAGVPVSAGTLRLIVIGLGLSGFTSFAYEIYWTRALVFVLGNSTYALSTMLLAFLTGIALGGYGIRLLFGRVRDLAALFGWIQVLLGVVSALALPLLFRLTDSQEVGQFLIQSGSRPLPLLLAGFGLACLVMLVPALLIGATFPLVGQIGVRSLRDSGATVGRIYAINTWGNVLGALLPGVILLAWLGIQRGILLMAGINVALGFILLFLRLWRAPRQMAWRLALPLVLVAITLFIGHSQLGFQFPSEGEAAHHRTLFYREGPLATTKVFEDPVAGEKHMSVDGIIIGGTGNTEFKQLLLAHLPKLLLDDVSRELSVGIGSGILAGESLLHDRVSSLTGVEIEPGVIQGAALFAQDNHGVLSNPRLRIVADDIGNFLRTTHDRYQVISADEKTADEYASNGFSYSLEYYELLLQHLEPGGLAAQWVPTTLPPNQYRMVLKTFSQVFPHVQLWYFLPAWKRGPFNTILIGSHRPIAIEPERIAARFAQQPDAFASLKRYGITSADALLPHFVAADDLLRSAVADAAINSLTHPRYEFYKPWDYAREREEKFADNHAMLMDLKRAAFPDYLAALSGQVDDPLRLRQALAAEDRYLAGFLRFLQGMPLDETYRVFDDALAVAPWNDSLRARIYAQYSYLAQSHSNLVERTMLMRRAEALYPTSRK